MLTEKIVEYVFFFGLLAGVAYLVWEIISPFAGSIALAAIVVTICYPMHEWVLRKLHNKHKSIAALISVFLVFTIVVIPLVLLGSFLLSEARSVIDIVSSGTQVSLENYMSSFESAIQNIVPGFSLDISNNVGRIANFIAANIGSIFASTATTIFLFFISLIASFYFFREGKDFTKYFVQISPLPDEDDEIIIKRLATAIRAVALGTVFIALIQGTLTAIGLSIFGFERAVLWGSIAAIGALIPGIGTTIVFLPAILYLIATGSYLVAVGVAVWGMLAVGIIDNILGPYLMSRGGSMHPFLILLAVLGGIVLFGPIGFILGPVALTLFIVLLELYSVYISNVRNN